MAWRVARSLEQLRREVNDVWPNRSKASDGTIGDQAHAASASDHNPNPQGVVCAFDITHDPANGPDIGVLFNLFASAPHPDLKYLIANRRIASRRDGFTVRPYTGIDPHTNHIHVSVGVGPDGRSVQPYDDLLPTWLTGAPQPEPPKPQEHDMTPGQCYDQGGRSWDVVIGDDQKAWAWVDDVPLPWAIEGGKWSSGVSARLRFDGMIVLKGRGLDGHLWQLIFDPQHADKGAAAVVDLGGHIYPP